MPEETTRQKGEEGFAPAGADASFAAEAVAVARAVSSPRPRRKRWLRRTLLTTAPVLVIAVGEPIARVVTAIRSADARGVSSRRHGVQRPLEDVGGRHLVYHLTPALAGHVDVFYQESLDRGGG